MSKFEQIQAEAAQRADEEAFCAVFDNAAIGMGILDFVGYWIKVNQALCELLGYSEQQLMSMTYLELTHADDVERSRALGDRLRSKELHFYHIEKRYLHRDGRAVWVNCSVTPRYRAQDNAATFVVLVEDVSERKKADAVLQLSHEKLRQLIAHQERIKEDERIRIARELHDELGGSLTACKANLSVAMLEDERAGRATNPRLQESCVLLDAAIDTVRKVITDLRPSVLDHLGIWTALEWQAERTQAHTGIACKIVVDGAAAASVVDDERATALFRILQETLTNVTRHADASAVEIRVCVEDGTIRMEVEDNGKGIDTQPETSGKSWGIAGMAERARYFGGDIALSNTSHGTLVSLSLPLQSKNDAGFAQLIWSDCFCCGEQTIDSQHLEMFVSANKLLAAILSGKSDGEVGSAVDTLVNGMARHFSEEEQVLTRIGYPDAAAHALQHQSLLHSATDLVQRFRAGKLEVGPLFQFLAHDLVASHMLNDDRAFFPYLAPAEG